MPTGYTYPVQQGEITELKDFALNCARAFGALVMMRDEPAGAEIPERFEPATSYHDTAIAGANAEIMVLMNLSLSALRKMAEEEVAETRARNQTYLEEHATARQRYESMLTKVKAWVPPTSEHAHLKTFMIEQLSESIRFESKPYVAPIPDTENIYAWQNRKITALRKTRDYHAEEREKEIVRTNSRNEWLADLRSSLEKADA